MITDKKTVQRADAFVKAYEPADGDHPDLASRVANYSAAVEGGSDPARQIHARTLMAFVDHLGLDSTSSDGDGGDEVLRGAALDQALDDAGLSKAGTADEKRARLAEHQADPGS